MSKLFRGRSPRLQGRLESPCGLMPQGNAQATADTFLAEAGVVDWIRALNERKGVAPPVADVAHKYQQLRQERGLETWPSSARAKRKWVGRLRLRSALKLRRLPQSEALTEAEIMLKVEASAFAVLCD